MNMTIEKIASICHEANRAYCKAIGDDSQLPWDQAQQWQRDSAIHGVAYKIEYGATPEQQHEEWFADKVRAGWVYGRVKDAIAKTHPCMLPYSELPPEQKTKDALFCAVVSALSGVLE